MRIKWDNLGQGLKDVASAIRDVKVARGLEQYDRLNPYESQIAAYDKYNQWLANQDRQTFGVEVTPQSYEYTPIIRQTDDERLLGRLQEEARLRRMFGDVDTARQLDMAAQGLRREIDQSKRQERQLQMQERLHELQAKHQENALREYEENKKKEEAIKNLTKVLFQAKMSGSPLPLEDAVRIGEQYGADPNQALQIAEFFNNISASEIQNRMEQRKLLAMEAISQGGVPALADLFNNHPLFKNNTTVEARRVDNAGNFVVTFYNKDGKAIRTIGPASELYIATQALYSLYDPITGYKFEQDALMSAAQRKLTEAQTLYYTMRAKDTTAGGDRWNLNQELFKIARNLCKDSPNPDLCVLNYLNKGNEKQPSPSDILTVAGQIREYAASIYPGFDKLPRAEQEKRLVEIAQGMGLPLQYIRAVAPSYYKLYMGEVEEKPNQEQPKAPPKKPSADYTHSTSTIDNLIEKTRKEIEDVQKSTNPAEKSRLPGLIQRLEALQKTKKATQQDGGGLALPPADLKSAVPSAPTPTPTIPKSATPLAPTFTPAPTPSTPPARTPAPTPTPTPTPTVPKSATPLTPAPTTTPTPTVPKPSTPPARTPTPTPTPTVPKSATPLTPPESKPSVPAPQEKGMTVPNTKQQLQGTIKGLENKLKEYERAMKSAKTEQDRKKAQENYNKTKKQLEGYRRQLDRMK